MKKNKYYIALSIFPALAMAHGGGLDKQGGHNNRKTGEYHCHREPCLSTHSQTQDELKTATPSSYRSLYSRKEWPHWVDGDNDCQSTRHELLIATSNRPVNFKDSRKCTVVLGEWYDVYTGKTFTRASDLDIDHIVPLAHAHRSGAANWSRGQKRIFANDPVNLIVVDDSTNQSKSDKAPHEWMPPRQGYWCTYIAKWVEVKEKYKLSSSANELAKIEQTRLNCQ